MVTEFNLRIHSVTAPKGFRPVGEIPRRHPSNSRVYIGKCYKLKYAVSKFLIFLNRGHMGSSGNDDVSIKRWLG